MENEAEKKREEESWQAEVVVHCAKMRPLREQWARETQERRGGSGVKTIELSAFILHEALPDYYLWIRWARVSASLIAWRCKVRAKISPRYLQPSPPRAREPHRVHGMPPRSG